MLSGGTMQKSIKLIALIVLLGIPARLYADRAHDLAKVAAKQKAVTGCNPASLTTQTCHAQFPTGCTESAHKYDAYLNFLKNQVPGAALASTALLSGTDFKSLEGQIPKTLHSSNHAKSAPALANLGEGNIVTVIAFLYFVEDTGKGANGQPSIGETTNCKLQLPGSYDFHIGLGFDPALAQQILQNNPQPVFGQPTEMEKTSVVAEIVLITGTAAATGVVTVGRYISMSFEKSVSSTSPVGSSMKFWWNEELLGALGGLPTRVNVLPFHSTMRVPFWKIPGLSASSTLPLGNRTPGPSALSSLAPLTTGESGAAVQVLVVGW